MTDLSASLPSVLGDDAPFSFSPRFRLERARNPLVALGLAVHHLMGKPAYARIGFATWAKVLAGQINRRHYWFVLDLDDRVVGMLGWAYADSNSAERWVRGEPVQFDGLSGDCVVFNVWSAQTDDVTPLVLDAARRIVKGRETFYYRRVYPDGRIRPVRMPVGRFIGRHLEQAFAETEDTAALAPPPKHSTRADGPALRVGRAKNPFLALGLAVDHLMDKPAYARFGFASWSRILVGQINRGEYRFVFDRQDRVVGMLAWGTLDRDAAERWVRGETLDERDTAPGNCIAFHLWSADIPEATEHLLHTARRAGMDREAAYFRRLYPDGRMRPVRLPTTFASTHLASHFAADMRIPTAMPEERP